jgi:hypothetical protein
MRHSFDRAGSPPALRSFASALLLLAALLPAGCGAIAPPVDTPVVPPWALGTNGDADQAAAGIAGWAFASPGNTAGRPVDAARGVISVEYLAGVLSSSPRYFNVSPLVQQQMLAARFEVRRALGVPASAPSQAVVDGLIGAETALLARDPAALERALTTPVFTLGPQATMQRLANLPPLPETNIATQRAQFQIQAPNDRVCFAC